MTNTYIATKNKMKQAWDKNGKRLSISVLETKPGVILQIKTKKSDGYDALVVGLGSKKESHVNKPQLNYYKKNKIKTHPRFIREIKTKDTSKYKIGDKISADQIFSEGDTVNVQGTTKGRGFTGVIKRWGFHGGPRTHGQSDRERAPGSIGQTTDPGRVHKGKKMPGHYGNQTRTIKNLTIVNVQPDEIWVSGPVPGSKNSNVKITKTGSKKFIGLDEGQENQSPKTDTNTKTADKDKNQKPETKKKQEVKKDKNSEKNTKPKSNKVNKEKTQQKNKKK